MGGCGARTVGEINTATLIDTGVPDSPIRAHHYPYADPSRNPPKDDPWNTNPSRYPR
jgi:hypothetical protein